MFLGGLKKLFVVLNNPSISGQTYICIWWKIPSSMAKRLSLTIERNVGADKLPDKYFNHPGKGPGSVKKKKELLQKHILNTWSLKATKETSLFWCSPCFSKLIRQKEEENIQSASENIKNYLPDQLCELSSRHKTRGEIKLYWVATLVTQCPRTNSIVFHSPYWQLLGLHWVILN